MSAGRLAQLSPANRHHAEQALARASEALKATGVEPSGRLWVPGRIEVLGKHTDYAGGRSLTCAVERGFAVAFTPRSAPRSASSTPTTGVTRVALADNLTPPVGEWINYPMTVARRLARNFPGLATGADIAFYSNLPRAASSARPARSLRPSPGAHVGQRSAGPPGVSAGAALGRRRRGLPRQHRERTGLRHPCRRLGRRHVRRQRGSHGDSPQRRGHNGSYHYRR